MLNLHDEICTLLSICRSLVLDPHRPGRVDKTNEKSILNIDFESLRIHITKPIVGLVLPL
jgi:hypothetical protein